jgi:phage terminase large subunit GpA-like protein
MTQATDELIKAFPKVWCPNCGARQPVEIAVMKADNRNDHDAADILCEACKFVVATLHAEARAQ